ncbi:1-hydroxycarotenoid 3,4-desaturase CrtD [Gaoshiqia sediminis]|uniref:Phytoene desaturase family protein n=1 Tax=Gaoshiqia sediminis TaxID=2986998 RepID=A0AA41Y942_9BACT|nr:1-hydroxycarotenoid 3,4-desaturase CrtD [Gaoshiqia sediminis]MCW0483223.1 phytoene desaturase family protein [Gaoshiqia sediminis]
MKLKAGIIGAGIGGLAAAIRLARLGYQVEVFEQSARAGGKLNEFRQDGFRFDTGPSLFTLPHLLDELLDEDLRFRYRKLDVVTQYFFDDGTRLSAFADVEKFATEVEQKTQVPAKRVLRYLKQAAQIYRLTAPIFIFNSIHRFRKLFTWPNLGRALQAFRLKPLSTLHGLNQKTFGDPRIIQLFDRYATYNGSNPYKTPGTLSVISHLEHNLGAYFPAGGMYQIVEALLAQANRLGVRFFYHTPVESVIAGKKSVSGLRVKGENRSYNLVVSDVDIHHFYRTLLPDSRRLKKMERTERSSSALIFYWGMKKRFPELELHNIFFSQDYRHEFSCLFEQKTITNDPTVYVFISSKENLADAPADMGNWFVMVNAPEAAGQNWEKLRQRTRQNILKKLQRILNQEIENQILFERILDPVTIEELTGSFQGAMYGPSSNSPFSAFNRHPNFRSDIAGLYFVGGTVHPGGGIPLCLSSANIVAEIVEEQLTEKK